MRSHNPWSPLQPAIAHDLGDARRQLHHAAQFATAIGISYLPHQADDSHTNLEWLPTHRALASRVVDTPAGDLRLAIRVPDLTLLLIEHETAVAVLELAGQTIAQATTWLRHHLEKFDLAAERYTLARHYEIPAHQVDGGSPFSVNPESLEELARWFGDAAEVLQSVRIENAGDAVRCWPHHFDIATLISVGEGRTIGVGLEPGDGYYDEPYFYVNAYPQPALSALTASLGGEGIWHTQDWVGAVLPASRLGEQQESQVCAFLESAVAASRSLVS